ncbi:hypothetical protein D3C80_1736390 [compost metagenome]
MEAAVAAFLIIGDIILLVQHFEILAGPDVLSYPADILNELAHNPDAGNILDARFQILHLHVQALRFFKYAGEPFYTSGYEFDWRVFLSLFELRAHCFEFNLEFLHSLFIWK